MVYEIFGRTLKKQNNMKRQEEICRGNAYEMTLDENGNECHVETMTLSGKDCTGEPCMSAKIGDFPNWEYRVPFGDAYKQLMQWWGQSLSSRLKHGENCTLAYAKDYRSRHNSVQIGEPMYEVAFDINYHKNNYYIKDGALRFKIVITKA